jgi:transcriptional regulator with XRE-family HTH domain
MEYFKRQEGDLMKIFQSRNIVGHMAMDSPMRRWRKSQNVTQTELARRVGVYVSTIAKWEQQFSRPRGEALERLVAVTGLSLEAILFPQRYLEEHPDFLATWAEVPPRRGRYPEEERRQRQQPPRRGRPSKRPPEGESGA